MLCGDPIFKIGERPANENFTAARGEYLTAFEVLCGVLGVLAGHLTQSTFAHAKDDSSDLRPVNRARTHRTGFHRSIEGRSAKGGKLEPTGGVAREVCFGVTGPPVNRMAVFALGNHLAGCVHENRSEWMVASQHRLVRQLDCSCQKAKIGLCG